MSGQAGSRWLVCGRASQCWRLASGKGDVALLACRLFMAARTRHCGRPGCVGAIIGVESVQSEQPPQVGAAEADLRGAWTGVGTASRIEGRKFLDIGAPDPR